MRVSDSLPVESVYAAKVANLARDTAKQQGEGAVQLIEAATVPEGTKGHNINIRV